MTEKIIQRFMDKVSKEENGCWTWTSTKHRDGYGKFWYKGKIVQAHRVSFILFNGEISKGLYICHKCDNRVCVNPQHLYQGTAKQNYDDSVDRKRFIGRRKIPYETVQETINLYSTGLYTQQEIADKLGIKQIQVSRYIRGNQRLNY